MEITKDISGYSATFNAKYDNGTIKSNKELTHIWNWRTRPEAPKALSKGLLNMSIVNSMITKRVNKMLYSGTVPNHKCSI